MKSLFGDNRIANMLQFFLKTPVITVSTLASKLDVSERTIRNDIKELNQELRECAIIEGKQGKYNLRIFNPSLFNKILADLLEADDFLNSPRNRMDYVFGKLMRAEKPVLIDELAYEMNMGRTTLVNDIKKLRMEIAEYNLSIIGKTSQGLLLHGLETDIRKYVLDKNYSQIYHQYPLDSEIVDEISGMFSKYSFEKKVQETFEQFVILMLDRFLTGHYIGNLSSEYYNLTSHQEFKMVNQLIDNISQILQVEFPIEEKLFALLPIIGMRTPADISEMQVIELDESVKELMKKIVIEIQYEMGIKIETGMFAEEFLYHLMFMLNRIRFGVHLVNPLLDDLKEKYPLAYQMAEVASRVISKEYEMKVNEDERGFLASYFGVFLTENDLKKKKKSQIAVVYEVGIVTARLIAAQLKKILDSSGELTLFANDKIKKEDLDEFDIILTTVNLPFEVGRPVIKIQEIFDERELLYKIEKAKYWDQIDIPMLDNNWFIMTGLLDESRLFLLEEATTYEEAKFCMVERLEELQQLDKGFWERLQEREKQNSMIFDHSVAIPHVMQYASDKLVLAIGILPEPIPYEGHHIRIIFLIGLPEQVNQDDSLLIRVYEEIINITQDEEMLEKLESVKNFHDLLRVLYRQVNES